METNENKIEVSADIQQIVEYHELLFSNTEERTSLKDQITSLKSDLEKTALEQQKLISDLNAYHYKIFIGSGEEDSTEIIINNLVENYTEKLAQLDKKQALFDAFYSLVFEGTSAETSYQNQFKSTLTQIKNDLKECEEEVRVVSNLYEKVIDTEVKGKKIFGLESTVVNMKNQLLTLITDANSKLHALTDSSLHNAFASRAKKYTEEFEDLQKYTFYSIGALIATMIVFGVIQMTIVVKGNPFNYHILIYQFSIAGALILAIWMLNRNQKIAKKLAEEYHHKASISEAMTGYRTLYALDHGNEEYLSLFNSIKDQLNINPSKHIDTFLNLKSPNEELTASVAKLADPENLKLFLEFMKTKPK